MKQKKLKLGDELDHLLVLGYHHWQAQSFSSRVSKVMMDDEVVLLESVNCDDDDNDDNH